MNSSLVECSHRKYICVEGVTSLLSLSVSAEVEDQFLSQSQLLLKLKLKD